MSQIIKKRIIPILLLVVLCFGMVPTAFAEAEITTIDTSTVTQTDVQGKPDTDITVVPNEDAGDLITDEGPDSGPVDESTSSSTDFSSTSSSEVHTPSNLEAASSSSVSSDNTVSSSSEAMRPNSSSPLSPAMTPESESVSIETNEEVKKAPAEIPVEIVRMNGASLFSTSAASAGTLSWTKHPEYQYDANLGMGSVNMQVWPTATINGQIAYCVQPENLNTHGSKPYDPIQYDQLSSTQRYAIGYAMLYGAQDAGNIPFHIATQTIIWEIVHGYMDLESFIATNKTAYNAVIGYNPAAAPYALRRKYRITQKEISAAMGVSRMRFVDIEQYGKPCTLEQLALLQEGFREVIRRRRRETTELEHDFHKLESCLLDTMPQERR